MDIKEVVERVKGIPWVRDVEVHRSLFGKLVLKIEERKPVALLVAGRLFPVDADGVVLSPLKVPPDLPLITG
ncbi:MAG: cell division protein FtsQ, partial [Candidatus Latescibacterota bacterium]